MICWEQSAGSLQILGETYERSFLMSQIQICDRCGARMEIQDSDNQEPNDEFFYEEEGVGWENIACENCARLDSLSKI